MSADAEEFRCGYVLTFADGGPDEEQVLHTGDRASCEALRRSLPAVCYSGSRPVVAASFVIVPATDREDPPA